VAYIVGAGGQQPEGKPLAGAKAAAPARTAKPAKKKGRSRVAGKRNNASRRWACWKCGTAMRKKGLACKRCRRSDPAAVKSQIATLTKSMGSVRPVPVTAARAPKPRCPNPACGAKGGRKANACSRCGTAFSREHAVRADKAVRSVQLAVHGSPEWWEARARREWNPADREQCYAEAARARQASGQEAAYAAGMIVKASGARSLREAWARETDPRAQQILYGVLYGQGG
jgi:hypothetical protein